MTRRNRIADLLRSEDEAMTARELSLQMGLSEKTVMRDLKHIAKSVRAQGEQVMVTPARCTDCGFTFRAQRTSTPSKCPRCRSERITPSAFTILSDGQ